MTKEKLQAMFAEWQKRLRLQDWKIYVEISRDRDMKFEGNGGEVHWQIEAKQAVINIIDPIDYPPNTMAEQDMEQTLVHELLHLHFAPFDAEHNTPADVAQEQAIHAIAEALVKLKREK